MATTTRTRTTRTRPVVPPTDDRMINMKEFAAMIGRPLDTTYKMKYKGDFPKHYVIGGVITIRVSEAEKWIQTKAQG